MDRNVSNLLSCGGVLNVALRKESVDRNISREISLIRPYASLSARRAWIEMQIPVFGGGGNGSLSARRAWIEIRFAWQLVTRSFSRSPQGERG